MTRDNRHRHQPLAASLLRSCSLLLFLLLLVPSALAQELGEEAREALQQGQQQAARAMTRYADHFPDRPLWQEAIAYGQRARELAPDRPEPYRFLGQVYSVTGWYSRAWDAWQAYQERGGEMDAQARTQLLAAATWLGFRNFSSGDYTNAIPFLETALRLNPQDRLTTRRLAQAHIALNDPQAALPYARQLAEADPAADDLLVQVNEYLEHGVEAVEALAAGQELYGQGRPAEAMTQIARAIEASPDYVEALRWGGRVALELDRPGEAADYWQRLVELEPQDQDAQAALQLAQNRARYGTEAYRAYQEGVTAYGAGDLELAEGRLRSALAQSPQLADAHAWLGRVMFERGEFEQAVERFQEAIRLAPEESSYRFFLSTAEEQLQLQREAQARAQEQARAEAEAEARAQAEQEAAEQAQAEQAAAEQAAAEQAAAEREAAEQAAREQAQAEAAAAAEQARAQAQAQAQEIERAQQQAEAAQEVTAETTQAAAAPAGPATATPAEQPEQAAEAAPALGPSASLLLADYTVVHQSAEAGGSGAFSFLPGNDLGRDLVSPVDYRAGTVHQRLEVISKPSDAAVHYQLCLVPNDSISVQPACSAADRLVFEEEGVYRAEQQLASFSGYAGINWQNGMESVILVIKDPSGVPVDNRYLLGNAGQEAPDPQLYYPMEVRYTAILVPEGGTFPGWPE